MSILAQLMETSRGKAVMTRLDPSLKGKCFTFYGRSDTGKTSQLCKLPNVVYIPLERGDSALSGVLKLSTHNWSDMEDHLNLLKSKQWTNILNSTDEPICVVIDGAEKMTRMAERRVCSDAQVKEIAQAGTRGAGYKKLENLVNDYIKDLLSLDYTVIFIAHPIMDEDGYIDIKGDRKRGIDTIIENSDVVCYLQPRPSDPETGMPGMSIAHFFAGENFFARSRYIEMIPKLDVFTAEGFTQAVYDGVVAEAKRTGATLVEASERLAVREEQQGNKFKLEFDECKEACLEMMDTLDEQGKSDVVDGILLRHFDTPDAFSNITKSQFETLQSIYHALVNQLEG